ncbi:hypothetical protein, partial [Burkholderia multivorans]|uniref:hypothetical protein n=2 Tax=Burkholderia multivorans TaxID=87883 RepID=UPI001C65C87E
EPGLIANGGRPLNMPAPPRGLYGASAKMPWSPISVARWNKSVPAVMLGISPCTVALLLAALPTVPVDTPPLPPGMTSSEPIAELPPPDHR